MAKVLQVVVLEVMFPALSLVPRFGFCDSSIKRGACGSSPSESEKKKKEKRNNITRVLFSIL
jgi:hypothetical protein